MAEGSTTGRDGEAMTREPHRKLQPGPGPGAKSIWV